MAQPLFVVLAGPNGSGKSTAASVLIEPLVTFVNADEIAKGLEGYPSRPVDLEAGRVALERMDRLADARADFALETTLASRSLAPRIRRLKESGYIVRLLFLFSPNPDFSLFRVASRVRAGAITYPRRRFVAAIAQAWSTSANSTGLSPTIGSSTIIQVRRGRKSSRSAMGTRPWRSSIRVCGPSSRKGWRPMGNEPAGPLDLRTASNEEITKAFARGVRAALREHKRAGRSVVVWDREKDRIVILRADQINVPDEPDA